MKRLRPTQVFFISIILIASLLLLQHLNNRETTRIEQTFKGESSNWKAELYVSGSSTFIKKPNKPVEYDSVSTSDFALTFKGDFQDLTLAKDFSYSYKLNSFKHELVEPHPSKTVFRHKNEGFSIYNIDDSTLVEVIVNWNGNTENFVLKSIKGH